MSISQEHIDKLKMDFKSVTHNSAEDNPVDFSAYLHLVQTKKIEQLFSFINLMQIDHSPSWAEIKNFLDHQRG